VTLQNGVAELEEQIASKNAALKALEEQLASTETELQNKNLQVGKLQECLRSEIETSSKRIQELHNQIDELTRKLSVADTTLEAVLNSKGWRLLNHFRDLRNRARKSLPWPIKGKLSTLYSAPALDPRAYRNWIKRIERPSYSPARFRDMMKGFTYQPRISILMPAYNTPQEYLEKAIESVRAQLYEDWELCICDDRSSVEPERLRKYLQDCCDSDPRIKVVFSPENEGISSASNRALSLATGEFVGLLDHDDELSPNALFECVNLLQAHPEADIIYSDEDKLEPDGTRCDPFFKPDWSPEFLLSCMYTCHFGVYRRTKVNAVGGFRKGFEGSQDYDLMLRLVERTQKVFHIPKILYHWRKSAGSTAASAAAKNGSIEAGRKALEEHMQRRGIPATVYNAGRENLYRVRPQISGLPLVSIIIPTKDGTSILRRCITSIENATSYRHFEILIVDNNSSSYSARKYFASIPHKVVRFSEPFNFSKINNFAVSHAKGDYFVFLNNDTEVSSREWLSSMLELCQMEGVGIVGAKLYYPNRSIQHAGVVLGVGGVAGHSHKYFAANSNGYFDSLIAVRNYSAVTAACMMVKREAFENVKGFDENLSVAFNDVDFCLRVREAGFRIVWTPYAELFHYESATRGYKTDPKEIAYMKARWGTALEKDPYYNPNLTLREENFALRV
jgi:O-antigen biosynthesis protein